jgi:hypothetical protein
MSGRTLVRSLALGALVLALGLGLHALRRARAPEALRTDAPLAPTPPVPAPPVAGTRPPLPPAAAATPARAVEEPDAFPVGSTIDLEAARAALPENSYWETSAPTQDERVLREREEAKARWNEAYGKVLSGTGTEEEIREYYAHRQRSSTDAIQLVDYLLEHQADGLAERDQELLHVARRLHLARLQEIPRKLEEATARKRQQDEARAAWLADEARFRGDADADATASADPGASGDATGEAERER